MEGEGLGSADLPGVYREQYLRAVESARLRHDPASDWDGFVEALWAALGSGLGLDVAVVDEAQHRHGLRVESGSAPANRRSSREVE